MKITIETDLTTDNMYELERDGHINLNDILYLLYWVDWEEKEDGTLDHLPDVWQDKNIKVRIQE